MSRECVSLTLAAVLAVGPSLAQSVTSAPGALLRGLDKVAGTTIDITVRNGESAAFGPLTVSVAECRYPTDNPSADAFANVDIMDSGGNALFGGWMVASSPALSALDHPRYDVWILSCILPEAEPEEPAEESNSDG
jgi:hypothetical protein